MFHALGVSNGVGFGDSEGSQEFQQELMPSLGGLGHASTGCCQGDGAIGLLHQQPLLGEPRQNPCDGDVTDSHSGGQILDSAGALRLQDLLDGFHVVLGGFRGVITPGLAELIGDWTHLRFPNVDLAGQEV